MKFSERCGREPDQRGQVRALCKRHCKNEIWFNLKALNDVSGFIPGNRVKSCSYNKPAQIPLLYEENLNILSEK